MHGDRPSIFELIQSDAMLGVIQPAIRQAVVIVSTHIPGQSSSGAEFGQLAAAQALSFPHRGLPPWLARGAVPADS